MARTRGKNNIMKKLLRENYTPVLCIQIFNLHENLHEITFFYDAWVFPVFSSLSQRRHINNHPKIIRQKINNAFIVKPQTFSPSKNLI